MASQLSPDQARNWFGALYAITEKSTPITLVFMLIIGTLFAWYTLRELHSSRLRSLGIYNQLLLAKDDQLKQAMEFANSLAKVSLHCNIPIKEVMPPEKENIPHNYFPP